MRRERRAGVRRTRSIIDHAGRSANVQIERTEIVEAPVELVYATVADVESYPEFLAEFESVRIRGEVVEMAVRAGPVTLKWTQKVTFDPNKSIGFTLLSGPFRSFRGGWEFRSASWERTRVIGPSSSWRCASRGSRGSSKPRSNGTPTGHYRRFNGGSSRSCAAGPNRTGRRPALHQPVPSRRPAEQNGRLALDPAMNDRIASHR